MGKKLEGDFRQVLARHPDKFYDVYLSQIHILSKNKKFAYFWLKYQWYLINDRQNGWLQIAINQKP